MFTYLEYLASTKQERAHMWGCLDCELYYMCEDKVCHKCGEKSPFLVSNCPGCYSDWMINVYKGAM